MTVTGPRVRDFTAGGRSLRVEIDVSPAYELVLSLFTFACEDRHEYEIGEDFFTTTYQAASPELRAGLDLISWAGELMVGLLAIVHELPAPKTVAALIERIESADPEEFRFDLLRCCLPGTDDLLRAAAAGDSAALETLVAQDEHAAKYQDRIRGVVARDGTELRDLIATTLRRYAEEFLPAERELLPVLERDAAEKEAMAGTMAPERLVEVATNGVTFAMQPDVSGVVLIPSIVVRPWVVIAESGSLRLFAYPVTDESMAADPDAPPEWVVKFYKALGDERRLRILRMLRDGPANLRELAERMDLTKSTVHHHISMLRRAGLVRVTVGADKEYSLRTDAVPQAGALLQGFLGTSGKEGP